MNRQKVRIFSGKPSKLMWDYINKLSEFSEPTFAALYVMGCRYQELEAVVDNLQRQIVALEQQHKSSSAVTRKRARMPRR